MDFTSDMYDRIVRTLEPTGGAGFDPAPRDLRCEAPEEAHREDSRGEDARGEDARGEPRVRARGGASAVVSGQPRPVRVRDVSRNGLGLLMAQPVEPGQQFAVTLAGGGAMSGLSLVCTSVYCRPVDHGLYSVGARLLCFSARA